MLHNDDGPGTKLTATAEYTDAVGGDSANGTYTVGVGSDASPRFSDTTATATVNENTATPHVVGTYTATGGTGDVSIFYIQPNTLLYKYEHRCAKFDRLAGFRGKPALIPPQSRLLPPMKVPPPFNRHDKRYRPNPKRRRARLNYLR